ncbi:hypothetical protein QBC40DRAFT_311056 [Triangularia verruculosa]|uniref:Kinesin light chain n=1 Tax=Triangularia verruculosa TaxID=2587418 RepID=A0AAN6X6G7_9PEZI|nr:hypothetical protein QBC40DRAFT_311056 [Triangularia verruculosa]
MVIVTGEERPETLPKPFTTIPFSRDPDFVDRGDILEQIDRRCSEPAARMTLVGLGGVGKSQLAIEYAHRVATRQPDAWVFWVHAGTYARVEEGWLFNERNGRWIMILDSADDRDVFYNANIAHGTTSGDERDRRPFTTYLPQSQNGSIIIITRNKELTDALTFLKKKLGSPADLDVAADLISFNYIRSKRPSAADLLSLMSFFDRQGIPMWVLKPSRTVKDTIPTLRSYHWCRYPWRCRRRSTPTRPQLDDIDDKMDSRFEDDVAILRDYCFIVIDEIGDKFEMRYEITQQMLGEARKIHKKRLGKKDMATLVSMSILALILKDRGQWEEAEKLEVQVIETRKTKLRADHPDTLTSIGNLASTYRHQGWWEEVEKLDLQEEAEKLFMQVIETFKTKLGADHPDTLRSMANLASTYRHQGWWEEAEKLEVQVMETSKTKLGVDHPSTLTSMANLASTYRNQGRWEEAEKLDVQVMETSKTKLGADHPNTLTSMANLASTFWNQGRWEEAEKLFIQVMETFKTKLGADHPDTLRSMGNLASTYRNQGRWEEAKKLEVQVMEISKTKLRADHPDTLRSMGNLASIYGNQGRWEEAKTLFMQVMEISKTKLGADHPDTLTSMANLASIYGNQGRWEEAEKLEVQVMEISKTKFGADHPDTLRSINNLAFTWKSQGRHSDAFVLMKDCVQARQRLLGAEYPDTLSSLATVADRTTGKYRKRLVLLVIDRPGWKPILELACSCTK